MLRGYPYAGMYTNGVAAFAEESDTMAKPAHPRQPATAGKLLYIAEVIPLANADDEPARMSSKVVQ